MCLLIFTHDSTTIPESHFRAAFNRNSDGAGFVYSQEGKLHLHKGFFTVKDLIEALPAAGSNPCIIHFRFATHGAKDKANCHPFEAGGGWAMGHNGVIDGFPMLPSESDTAAFVRLAVKPYTEAHSEIVKLKEFQDYWAGCIGGSKLAFLHEDGSYVIVNEDKYSGHWSEDKKTWYSNSTYEAPKYVSKGGYSSYGAWGDEQEFFPKAGKQGGDTRQLSTDEAMAKKEFESVLRTLGVKEQDCCSWCVKPPSGRIFTTDDGDYVCETCVIDSFNMMVGVDAFDSAEVEKLNEALALDADKHYTSQD